MVYQKNMQENQELQESYESIVNSITDKIVNGTEINQDIIEKSTETLNENRINRIRNNKNQGMLFFKDEGARMIYDQLINLSKMLPESEFDKVAQGIVNGYNYQKDKGEKDGEIK